MFQRWLVGLRDDHEHQIRWSKEGLFWLLNAVNIFSFIVFWLNFFGKKYPIPEPHYILFYWTLHAVYAAIKEKAKSRGICEPRLGELWVPVWPVSLFIMIVAKTFARDGFSIPLELVGVTAASFISWYHSLSKKLNAVGANHQKPNGA